MDQPTAGRAPRQVTAGEIRVNINVDILRFDSIDELIDQAGIVDQLSHKLFLRP